MDSAGERAAVVAWLRSKAVESNLDCLFDDRDVFDEAAEAIERGDHLAVRTAIEREGAE